MCMCHASFALICFVCTDMLSHVLALGCVDNEWYVLMDGRRTREPPFFCNNPNLQGSGWWDGMGLLLERTGLLGLCKAGWTWMQFSQAEGIELLPQDHPKAWLWTECCCLPKCKQWLGGNPTYKLKVCPGYTKDSGSLNRGYLKVKELAFHRENDFEFYLHRFLCYMYRGPPPSPELEVAHLCQHKLCILPWHMAWMPHAWNIQMHFEHKKHNDYAPPRPKADRPQREGAKRARAV